MSAKNRNYDPMSDDGYDSKIPLHNDEAFQHGIQYSAKVRSQRKSFAIRIMSFVVYWFIGSIKASKSNGNRFCNASYSRKKK